MDTTSAQSTQTNNKQQRIPPQPDPASGGTNNNEPTTDNLPTSPAGGQPTTSSPISPSSLPPAGLNQPPVPPLSIPLHSWTVVNAENEQKETEGKKSLNQPLSTPTSPSFPTPTMHFSPPPHPTVPLENIPKERQKTQQTHLNYAETITNPPSSIHPTGNISNTSHRAQPRRGFPFMIVTGLLFIAMAGFGGSFLYFRFGSDIFKSTQVAVVPKVTPPVSLPQTNLSPTLTQNVNPFASPTPVSANPFREPTVAIENPFGDTENPFEVASAAEGQAYKNPFEGVK